MVTTRALAAPRVPLVRGLPIPFDVRSVVVVGMVLTYMWRFQDLSSVFAPFRLAAVLTLAAWGLLIFQPNGSVLRKGLGRSYSVLFLIWTVWIGVTAPFALVPSVAWDFFSESHFGNAMMFVFLVSSITRARELNIAIAAHGLGAAVIAAYYVKQGFPTLWTPLTGVDRNDLALMLNTAIPMVMLFGLALPERLHRNVAWATAAMMATCVLFSQSRGGFLTMAFIGLYMGLRLKQVKLHLRLLPVVALILGVIFAPPEVKDRLRTLLDTEQDYNTQSDVGRIQIWQRGWGYLTDNPVTGVGASNFSIAEGTLSEGSRTQTQWKASVAHNIYVEVGVETGFIGGFLYIAMIIAALVRLSKLRAAVLRKRLARSWVNLCDLLTVAIGAFAINGMFLTFGYSPFLFFLIALVAGAEQSYETAMRQAARGARRGPGGRKAVKGGRRRRRTPAPAAGVVLGMPPTSPG